MQNKLNKTLGLADVFCISAGAMISSGIFILPGIAYANIGPAMFISYLMAGIFAMTGALATVELATAMPLAGGIYYYTGRSMGPLAGTVSGLLNWSAIALKSAFAIFGLSEVIYQFFHINPIFSGVAMTLIFLAVNLIGTKEAAWAQIIMVALLFAALGSYIALGFPHLEASRFSPLFGNGKNASALFAEAAFVFVAFGGLLDVASISEEVKKPARNLPLGMLGAIVAVTICYALTLIVTVGALEGEKLANSLTPLADTAGKYYGTIGIAVITLGAVMAFVTTANAGVMAAARFPYAMGRDKLIPGFFSRTYGKKKMPLPALLITGLAMVLVQFLDLKTLVTVASTVIMLSFILTNSSVIILRESGIRNYKPTFRMPFYPLTPIISMLAFALLIMELGLESVRISLAIIIVGIILYFVFGRKTSRESALVYLVRKITRKRIDVHGLERELRDIVRDRDGIVNDEFDNLVEHAPVKFFTGQDNFDHVAQIISESGFSYKGMSADELAQSLIAREHTSSTALTPAAAVPHIIVDGEGIFELAIAINPNGIFINRHAPGVKIAFFLIASHDCRNRHLRTLTAIAQIISSPDFEKKLQSTVHEEQVRDLLLLATRKRTHHDKAAKHE